MTMQRCDTGEVSHVLIGTTIAPSPPDARLRRVRCRFFADRLPRVADSRAAARLKTELRASEWPTWAAATAVVTDYGHSSLDYLSPVDFELRLARQRATA